MLHKTKSVFLKLFLLLCVICCAFALAIGVAACSDEATTIQSVDVVNGELVVTYSDGSTENLGSVVGEDGKDGTDGTDGKDGADGADGADGKDGTDGEDGANGADGIGIDDADINDDGELVLTLTDGTTINVGVVKGADGANGADGENGLDGVGIANVEITADGKIEITYTDGNTETFDFPVIEDEECEHEYQEIVLTEMYCGTGEEQEGVMLNVCTVCGSSYVSAIEVAHNYVAKVTDATCTEDGYTAEVCTVCDEEDETVGHYAITEALGHDYDTTPVYVAASGETVCEDGGWAVYACANGCGTYVAEVAPAQGHVITSYEVTKTPTDEQTGTLSGYCSVCGTYASEVTLPQLEWVTDENGTQYFELEGYEIVSVDKTEGTAVVTYTFNGETFEIEEVTLPEHGHVLNGEIIDTEKTYLIDDYDDMSFIDNSSTCSETNPGTAIFYCEDCGDIVQVSARTSHAEKEDVSEGDNYTEPTCTVDGSWTYKCSECGEDVEVTIPATGHSYVYTATESDGVLTVTGTCQNEGCDTPASFEVEEEYTSNVKTEATCEDEGEVVYTFVYEGEEWTVTGTLDVTAHTLNSVLMTEESYPSTTEGIDYTGTACSENGVTGYYTCDVCDELISVTVKDDHTESADAKIVIIGVSVDEEGNVIESVPDEKDGVENIVYVTEATCTSGEVRVFYCTVCNTWQTTTGEELGHSYEVESVNVAESKVTLVCTVCEGSTTVTLPALGADEDEDGVDDNYTVTVISEATCTTEGITKYTYTFEEADDTFTVSFEVVTEKLDHTHGDEITIMVGEDEEEYKAYICEVCGNIVDMAVAPVSM